jgi:hypothetical protein
MPSDSPPAGQHHHFDLAYYVTQFLLCAGALEYSMHSLATGDVVNLTYVSGSSPNLFICQFSDGFKQLEALMKEVATHVASLETHVPAESLSVGSPLLAKFSGDNEWYRGEVLSPKSPDGKITVSFVDYGNAEPVSVADTLPIPQRLTTLHKQATTCSLGSISGVTREEWSEEAFTKFEELVLASECLSATILECREGQVVVALKTDSGLDVIDIL